MAKTVEGWLCRDRDGGVWFGGIPQPEMDLGGNWWLADEDAGEWETAAEFLAEYDLTYNGKPCGLPRPGKKFLVDMEI